MVIIINIYILRKSGFKKVAGLGWAELSWRVERNDDMTFDFLWDNRKISPFFSLEKWGRVGAHSRSRSLPVPLTYGFVICLLIYYYF